jgi:hypothetical protein
VRLHHRTQIRPRDDLVHRLEEHVAPRRPTELLEAFVGGHGKGLLLHAPINASGSLTVDLFQRSLN